MADYVLAVIFGTCRERITHTCTHHTKGVHSFVWCHAYSCFASCGLERDVTVWHVRDYLSTPPGGTWRAGGMNAT